MRFSQRLCKEFPVEVIKPPRAPGAGSLDSVLATRKLTREQRASRAQFLHLLQQLDQSEYGEPDAKRQKTSAGANAFAKEDHAYEMKRQNEEIRRRLHKALGGHQTQASVPLAIRKLAPRVLMGNALSKPSAVSCDGHGIDITFLLADHLVHLWLVGTGSFAAPLCQRFPVHDPPEAAQGRDPRARRQASISVTRW